MSEQKHYFISNVAQWVTVSKLEQVSKAVKNLKEDMPRLPVKVYEVPLPAHAAYEIESFKPVVAGIKLIEQYE